MQVKSLEDLFRHSFKSNTQPPSAAHQPENKEKHKTVARNQSLDTGRRVVDVDGSTLVIPNLICVVAPGRGAKMAILCMRLSQLYIHSERNDGVSGDFAANCEIGKIAKGSATFTRAQELTRENILRLRCKKICREQRLPQSVVVLR